MWKTRSFGNDRIVIRLACGYARLLCESVTHLPTEVGKAGYLRRGHTTSRNDRQIWLRLDASTLLWNTSAAIWSTFAQEMRTNLLRNFGEDHQAFTLWWQVSRWLHNN